MAGIVSWLGSNWIVVLALSAYIAANVLPRPSGGESKGVVRLFWVTLDLICFLTANALPGKLKMPLLAYSPAAVSPPAPPGENGSAT